MATALKAGEDGRVACGGMTKREEEVGLSAACRQEKKRKSAGETEELEREREN